MEAGVCAERLANRRALMGGVAVQGDVDLQVRGHVAIDAGT